LKVVAEASRVIEGLSQSKQGAGVTEPARRHKAAQGDSISYCRAVEDESAAAAAKRANPKDLETMHAELRGMERTQHDGVAYGKYDIAFHKAIAIAAGN
jgi:DNA-binding FadR family transcriptional regulator